jgi:hypothetical protein
VVVNGAYIGSTNTKLELEDGLYEVSLGPAFSPDSAWTARDAEIPQEAGL